MRTSCRKGYTADVMRAVPESVVWGCGVSVFFLKPDNARERAAAAWKHACEFLQLGKTVRMRVDECIPTRSLEQNAMFHAICGDLSKQKQWAGEWRDTEDWKRLLVDAWARVEAKEQVEMVPSLDGKGVVNLGIQTHKMRVGEMADLITFAQSYCVENEVELAA